MVTRLIKTQNYRIKDRITSSLPKLKKNRNILKYISDIPKPLRKKSSAGCNVILPLRPILDTFPWEEQPRNYQSCRLKEMFQSGIILRAAVLRV